MSTRQEQPLLDGMERYVEDEAWGCVLRANDAYRREFQRRQKEGLTQNPAESEK